MNSPLEFYMVPLVPQLASSLLLVSLFYENADALGGETYPRMSKILEYETVDENTRRVSLHLHVDSILDITGE